LGNFLGPIVDIMMKFSVLKLILATFSQAKYEADAQLQYL
jgi:hypothetical protein